MFKSRQVTEFREHSDGRDELHTAHRLQPEYGRIEPPVDDRLAQGRLETLACPQRVLDRASMFVKRQLLPLAVKRMLTQPASMGWAPVGVAGIAHPVREQERLQSMPRLSEVISGACPRASQIPERFIFNAWHVHGRQVTRT